VTQKKRMMKSRFRMISLQKRRAKVRRSFRRKPILKTTRVTHLKSRRNQTMKKRSQ
jgi:hypothetical protein